MNTSRNTLAPRERINIGHCYDPAKIVQLLGSLGEAFRVDPKATLTVQNEMREFAAELTDGYQSTKSNPRGHAAYIQRVGVEYQRYRGYGEIRISLHLALPGPGELIWKTRKVFSQVTDHTPNAQEKAQLSRELLHFFTTARLDRYPTHDLCFHPRRSHRYDPSIHCEEAYLMQCGDIMYTSRWEVRLTLESVRLETEGQLVVDWIIK